MAAPATVPRYLLDGASRRRGSGREALVHEPPEGQARPMEQPRIEERKRPNTPRWSWTIGLIGLLGVIANTQLDETWRELTYPAYGAVASLCALIISFRSRRSRWPWVLFAIAFALTATADFLYTHVSDVFPGPADFTYLVGYVFALAGAVAFRHTRLRKDIDRLIDSGILAVAVGLALWALWVQPHVPESLGIDQIVAMSYPALDVALLVLLLGGVLASAPRSTAWLGLGFILWTVADAWYAIDALNRTYVGGGWQDSVWMLGYVAFASGALDSDTLPSRRIGVSLAPRIVVAIGLSVAPATLLAQSLLGDHIDAVPIGACGLVLSALLIMKLWRAHAHLESVLRSLSESEKKFRTFVDGAQDFLFRYDVRPVGRFEYVSPMVDVFTGHSADEHYADPDLARHYIHPDDWHMIEEIDEILAVPSRTIELRFVHEDGRVVHTEQHLTATYDDEGALLWIDGIARDITRQQQAVEALAESESFFKSVFEDSATAMAVSDLGGVVVRANAAACRMLGYEETEAAGISLADVVHPDDVVTLPSLVGGAEHQERRLSAKDGSVVWARVVISLVGDATGRPRYFVTQALASPKRSALERRSDSCNSGTS